MRGIIGFSAILGLLSSGCLVSSSGHPPIEYIDVGCWAVGITDFSSQSLPSSNDFAPVQATGIPDTQDWSNPQCVDSPLAWSPEFENFGQEWIDVLFATELYVDRVRIYENFGPGASDIVTLINTNDPGIPAAQFQVPSGLQGPGQPCSVLNLDIDNVNGAEFTNDPYDKVALDLDTTLSPGFNEIDAIQLVGQMDDRDPVPNSCDVL